MIKLINDDSTKIFEDVIKLGGDRQIVIVTDPPFNVGYKYNSYKDNMKENDYYNMLSLFFKDYPSVIVHYPESLYKIALNIQKAPVKVISWVYNSNTAKQHRDIAFFDVKPDMSKIRQPYKNLKDKRIQERIARGCKGAKLYDWWEINQVKNISKEKTEHPCQMPIEVMKRIIGILPDDILVIDPFMGSGTTGIACKIFNKDFIGIEFDKRYFEIASKRINEYETDKQISLFDIID